MDGEKSSDEIHIAELANRLHEESKPLCPQFRSYSLERLYPVQGHCALSGFPGWFMIPSIEEYRTYCTRVAFVLCPWFGRAREAAEPGAQFPGEQAARSELGWPTQASKTTP